MCFLSTSSHELCYLNTLFVSSIPGISHTDSKEDINKTQKTTQNLPKPQAIPGQCSGDTSFPQKNTAAPTEAAPEQSDLGLLGLMHQADWVLLLLQKRKKKQKKTLKQQPADTQLLATWCWGLSSQELSHRVNVSLRTRF